MASQTDHKQYELIKGVEQRIFRDEDSVTHWPEDYINVANKTVLDLGCGGFGRLIGYPGQSTLIHFLNCGAKKVIGIDMNEVDIKWTRDTLDAGYPQHDASKFELIGAKVENAAQIKDWIELYKPDIIKSDTEGAEQYILDLEDDVFNSIKEYYIETHSESLTILFKDKFLRHDYRIKGEMFYPANEQIGLMFVFKNNRS